MTAGGGGASATTPIGGFVQVGTQGLGSSGASLLHTVGLPASRFATALANSKFRLPDDSWTLAPSSSGSFQHFKDLQLTMSHQISDHAFVEIGGDVNRVYNVRDLLEQSGTSRVSQKPIYESHTLNVQQAIKQGWPLKKISDTINFEVMAELERTREQIAALTTALEERAREAETAGQRAAAAESVVAGLCRLVKVTRMYDGANQASAQAISALLSATGDFAAKSSASSHVASRNTSCQFSGSTVKFLCFGTPGLRMSGFVNRCLCWT